MPAEADTHSLLLRRDLRGEIHPPAWPGSITLSTLQPEDAAAVHRLLSLHGGEPVPWDQWQACFKADAEYDPGLCLVLRHGTQIIAVAQGWTSAFIKDLVVHEDYRRQGLGLRLLEALFRCFQHRGEPYVDLRVREHNHAARRLYERCGLCQVDRYAL